MRRHTFAPGAGGRQYDHEVLDISRVVRVVKGGRRFRFRATVLVGDRNGRVGMGIGKSRDVQQAIQKAQDQAGRDMKQVVMKDGTIPHVVEAKFKGAQITLRPARPGTGIIAGAVIRAIVDLAGVRDIVSKVYGSSNRISNARATLKALGQLKA
ncbi:MAG: 30S ribosomal protein S5 [Candidatus Andersenbacteria bacterium]|nr:30S ribosomal protein S5 [Candidatus Andersenbacteria bacterium]